MELPISELIEKRYRPAKAGRFLAWHTSRSLDASSDSFPAEATRSEFSNSKQPESLWKLHGLSPGQLGLRVFEQIVSNNVFGRSAELAFYFLFALFPMILLMMTLFGLFASHSVELQNDFLSYFADFLPPTAFQLLRNVAAELGVHASHGKLTFGAISALWCISGGVSTMISALNAAHHVSENRSWFTVRAIALGLSLLVSVLLLTALVVALVGSHFINWLGAGIQLDPILVFAWKAVQWPAAIFFVGFSCSLIYRYGPDLKSRGRWHVFTPGAAFGSLVWLLTSFGFRAYLHFFNNYSLSYGSLGAVMILLAWLYITGLAYLVGGEINAVLEQRPRRASTTELRTP